MRFRKLAIGASLYLGAVAIGLGSAWWALKKSAWLLAPVTAGVWKGSLLAGSPDADLYTRAAVALNALLALGRDETMYFVATQDDSGRPLRAACTYRITGTPPAARWWSITAYADDLFLFDAPNGQFSLNATRAAVDAQGQFALVTGPTPPRDGTWWLPTPGQRGLVLTLRLYNPLPSLQASPASLVAPVVVRIGECA